MSESYNRPSVVARSCVPPDSSVGSSVVSLLNSPSMPAMWRSSDVGATYDWGDYICVLQRDSQTFAELQIQLGLIDSQQASGIREHLKRCRLAYPYSLFCYWKKGRNPDGMDSHRPARVYTLETSIAEPLPILCAFTPCGHLNYGTCSIPNTETNCVRMLLDALTDGHWEDAKCIGPMSVGYEMVTGKPMPDLRSSSPRKPRREMDPDLKALLIWLCQAIGFILFIVFIVTHC